MGGLLKLKGKEHSVTVLACVEIVRDLPILNEADLQERDFIRSLAIMLYGTLRKRYGLHELYPVCSRYMHGLTQDFVQRLIDNLFESGIWVKGHRYSREKKAHAVVDWMSKDGDVAFMLDGLCALGTIVRRGKFYGLREWANDPEKWLPPQDVQAQMKKGIRPWLSLPFETEQALLKPERSPLLLPGAERPQIPAAPANPAPCLHREALS